VPLFVQKISNPVTVAFRFKKLAEQQTVYRTDVSVFADTGVGRQNVVKLIHTKFHENLFRGFRVI